MADPPRSPLTELHMDIVFERPAALFLLLLIPALWMLPRPVRDWRHGIIRSLVFLFLVLALARPINIGEGEQRKVVLVVDRTQSAAAIDNSSVNWSKVSELAERAEAELEVVALGSAPSQLKADGIPVTELVTKGKASPLGTALSMAAALLPQEGASAVALISDMKATGSDVGPALQSLSSRGIPLHVQVLDGGNHAPRPYRLHAGERLRVGRTCRLLVELTGTGPIKRMRIEESKDYGVDLENLNVQGHALVSVLYEPHQSGFVPIRVLVETEAGDTRELSTIIPVDDPLRILHVAQRSPDSGDRLNQLLGPGFQVETVLGTDATPETLSQHDLVMINDCPASALSEEFQNRLSDAVTRDGLGLVMSGGEGAFGPGGYHDTPVADLLPVEAMQKEEKKDPSTALAIIIDTSGSMGGQRIILAKEVARLAIRRLLPHDKVGIVEFYGAKRWAAPLQSAANAIAIQRALNRLDAGGGTVILPAIEEAYYGMKNVQTRYKHVLILTDAGVEAGAFEPILRRMARDGICVSTVLVGPDRHSEFLVELAQWGNGRYYNASDRFNLPEVILKQPSTSRLPAWREGTHTVRTTGGASWWGDVDRSTIPDLNGYVETQVRPGGEVLLETTRDSHPILASWQFGLGRTTAFMSQPVGPGTDSWQDWESYGTALSRILTRTAGDELAPYRFTLDRNAGALRVKAQRMDPRAPEPEARLLSDEGDPLAITFHQSAPHEFIATFAIEDTATARVEAQVGKRIGTRRRLISLPLALPGDELAAPALDATALATATGGQVWDTQFPNTIALGDARKSITGTPLWPWLALCALLAFLADIFWRRLPGNPESE